MTNELTQALEQMEHDQLTAPSQCQAVTWERVVRLAGSPGEAQRLMQQRADDRLAAWYAAREDGEPASAF